MVDSHDLWGDIQLRIWLPALDATVQSRPDRLFPHSESAAALRLAEDCPARRKFLARLQGETNKRGPWTCCGAASGTVPTTWSSSAAPHRSHHSGHHRKLHPVAGGEGHEDRQEEAEADLAPPPATRPGKRYLIHQHFAGGGKSFSIAWLAHQMIPLKKDGSTAFDSIIVITDPPDIGPPDPGHDQAIRAGGVHRGARRTVGAISGVSSGRARRSSSRRSSSSPSSSTRSGMPTATAASRSSSTKRIRARAGRPPKATERAVLGIVRDNTQLFKVFADNPDFRRWLVDTAFRLAYEATG